MRHRRDRHAEQRMEIMDAQLLVRQREEKAQSVRVAHRAKDLGQVTKVRPRRHLPPDSHDPIAVDGMGVTGSHRVFSLP